MSKIMLKYNWDSSFMAKIWIKKQYMINLFKI